MIEPKSIQCNESEESPIQREIRSTTVTTSFIDSRLDHGGLLHTAVLNPSFLILELLSNVFLILQRLKIFSKITIKYILTIH